MFSFYFWALALGLYDITFTVTFVMIAAAIMELLYTCWVYLVGSPTIQSLNPIEMRLAEQHFVPLGAKVSTWFDETFWWL